MASNPLDVRSATRMDPLRTLEEIKRLALEQLGGLPGGLYEPVEDALKLAARGDDSPSAPQVLYQNQAALWVLRQHHAIHVMRYRQQVAQGFDDFRALRIRSRGDLPLGLIDETHIDFHLAGQTLTEVIEQRFARPLETMDSRLRAVTAMLGLPNPSNPIGSVRLAAAFVETYSDEQIPTALRVLLFTQYEKELLRVLGELYAKVNTLLASSGYDLEPASARGAMPNRPSGSPAGAGGGGSGFGLGESGVGNPGSGAGVAPMGGQANGTFGVGDAGGFAYSNGGVATTPAELGELRSILHAWRAGTLGPEARTPDPTSPAPTRPARRQLRVDEVLTVASLLQGEPADVFARALADSGRLAVAIRRQLNDGSRRLGHNPEQISFSVEEDHAIDLVALLFDSLFTSQQLQDRARRLYAPLVLPYVKVAMSDPGLFVQPGHPARRLLDAITEACAGNRAETPQDRELLDRATAVAQRVVAEYNEDATIFETAHGELEAVLQQQRLRIELQAERAAKATFGRERLHRAREQADEVLARRVAAPPLSRVVSDFLGTSWRHHLVQTLLRDGDHSEVFAQAVTLGDALVDADRIAADGRGRELAERLLALEPAIVVCLGSSGLDHSAAEHGFAVLVKGLVYPNAPRDLHPPPVAQADDDGAERGLWLADVADAPRVDPAVVERMGKLQPGEWMQLTDLADATVDAKVAWVSPLTKRRLLVNRRGLRVLVASASELAGLAAAGRLRLGCEPTAFEQAMRHMREQLQGVASHR